MENWQINEEHEMWEEALQLWNSTDKVDEGLIRGYYGVLRPKKECVRRSPPMNLIKANMDAAFQMMTGEAPLDAVFRNSCDKSKQVQGLISRRLTTNTC
ncbi:hypothetical protein DITRI_Ditri13aG0074400 [Diplodiscus trichospermus]